MEFHFHPSKENLSKIVIYVCSGTILWKLLYDALPVYFEYYLSFPFLFLGVFVTIIAISNKHHQTTKTHRRKDDRIDNPQLPLM